MPIDFDEINSQFINDLDKMQEDFIKRLEQALKGELSDAALAQLDAEIDFFEELNKQGYELRVAKYIKNYDLIVVEIHKQAVLRGLSGVVGVTALDLEILIANEEIFLLEKGRLYAQQLKNAVFRNLIAGQPLGEILPTLSNIHLTDAQLTIEIDTATSNFEAVATAKIFEESPNQRFVLAGPSDFKTRASCAAVLRHQPKEGFTKAEIDAGAWSKLALEFISEKEHSPSEVKTVQEQGYTFVKRGTFNCRHQPHPKGIEL